MTLPSLKIGDLTATMPVVQGGMGVGISLSGLASAVANEGGIGVIAAAMIGLLDKDVTKDPLAANLRALNREILKAREKTQGLIGVNIMVALTHFSQLVRTAIESRADFIFSGAGLPTDLPKHLLEACEQKKEDFKTKLVPIVSSARAASILARKWMRNFNYTPDAFVVEGPKAGGHLGFKEEEITNPSFSLEQIVPPIVDVAKELEDKCGRAVPVIAGGGIFTGADIRRMLELGASGVQMATRFVATEECDANIRFKEAYVKAKPEDVTIIHSPVGMPGRAIDNDFIEASRKGLKKPFRCIYHCVKTCNREKTPYCIALALLSAMRGNLKTGFAFCGTNVGRIDRISTVHEVMESLRREYEESAPKRGTLGAPFFCGIGYLPHHRSTGHVSRRFN